MFLRIISVVLRSIPVFLIIAIIRCIRHCPAHYFRQPSVGRGDLYRTCSYYVKFIFIEFIIILSNHPGGHIITFDICSSIHGLRLVNLTVDSDITAYRHYEFRANTHRSPHIS